MMMMMITIMHSKIQKAYWDKKTTEPAEMNHRKLDQHTVCSVRSNSNVQRNWLANPLGSPKPDIGYYSHICCCSHLEPYLMISKLQDI